MKRITFYEKRDDVVIGGGSHCIRSYVRGLTQLGIEAKITADPAKLRNIDLVVLEDINWDTTQEEKWLKFTGIPYFVQPYCHDIIQYARPSRGLYAFLLPLIEGTAVENHHLETLLQAPEIINYTPYYPSAKLLNNRSVVVSAKCILTSDPTESKVVKRYFPQARVKHNFLSPGCATGPIEITDEFLQFSGLNYNSYLLQIGRIEIRKNLLTAVMAARNVDIPMVVISYNEYPEYKEYCQTVFNAIIKYRKAPTYIYTNSFPARQEGSLKIIPLQTPFSRSMILSAIGNCGLFLQPSFQELPGYVFLEAAKLGVPAIASKWCSVHEYFTEDGKYTLDDRIAYPLPYHIDAIESHIEAMFAKRYADSDHPIFKRTEVDMARDFLAIAEKALI